VVCCARLAADSPAVAAAVVAATAAGDVVGGVWAADAALPSPSAGDAALALDKRLLSCCTSIFWFMASEYSQVPFISEVLTLCRVWRWVMSFNHDVPR